VPVAAGLERCHVRLRVERVTEMIHPTGPNLAPNRVRFSDSSPVRNRPAGTATCACWASYSVPPVRRGAFANGGNHFSNSARFESIYQFLLHLIRSRRAFVYHGRDLCGSECTRPSPFPSTRRAAGGATA